MTQPEASKAGQLYHPPSPPFPPHTHPIPTQLVVESPAAQTEELLHVPKNLAQHVLLQSATNICVYE